MLIVQLCLYCLIFTVMVKLAVRGGAVDGLYFYPKDVQERPIYRATIDRKCERFMTAFYLVMLVVLLGIIGAWNRVTEFKTAYLQALLFLEVMNWYDGIVIDKLWVGRSKFWVLPGLENVPFIQTWGQMLKKRIIYSAVWVVGALLAAGLVVLIF